VAENELLDVASARRWAETRNDLRAGAAPVVVARHAVEELNRSVRNTLALAWRKGQTTLESLLHADRLGHTARREAVDCFNDHTLPRMVMNARKLPGCDDRATLVSNLASLIIDKVRDQIVRHSIETSRYQAVGEREALSKVLASQLDLVRPQIAAAIDQSLRGLRVKSVLRPRASQASKQVRARTVLDQTLLSPVVSQIHAQRRH
jgi:hypothetical protein